MSHICCYSSNQDNKDYFMVSVKEDFFKLILMESKIEEINRIINQMYVGLFRYEEENELVHPLEKVAIRKDSLLGVYMVEHPDLFYNEDDDISYEKIVQAYDIAAFDEEVKICNKIGPLFRSGFSGTKEDYEDFLPPNIVSYIKENHDFWYHVKSKEGNYSFLVYEDEKYQRQVLKRGVNQEKVKS